MGGGGINTGRLDSFVLEPLTYTEKSLIKSSLPLRAWIDEIIGLRCCSLSNYPVFEGVLDKVAEVVLTAGDVEALKL